MIGSRDRRSDGKPIKIRFGETKTPGPNGAAEQSYEYPAKEWSAMEARLHCGKKGGISFTPAAPPEVGAAAAKLKSSIKGV